MKKVYKTFYLHKSALEELTQEDLQAVAMALDKVTALFSFEIVKIDKVSGNISFIQSANWETANEPDVGDSYCVKLDGTVKVVKSSGKVYHHKWQFVSDSYTGFNIEESKARSKVVDRISVGNKSRIGSKKFWVSLLELNSIPQ